MRRTILLALLAAASAQLEHSISEATSWSSLRRAALGDKGAERLEETLELGGKRRGGASRSWSGMVYDRLPNAMQSVGIGQDLFRAAKKDPQLANTLKEAAAGYYRKASGMPEPGQQPGIGNIPNPLAPEVPEAPADSGGGRMRAKGRGLESPDERM